MLGELGCDTLWPQLHFWENDFPVETRGKDLTKHLLSMRTQEINDSWIKVVPHGDRRRR